MEQKQFGILPDKFLATLNVKDDGTPEIPKFKIYNQDGTEKDTTNTVWSAIPLVKTPAPPVNANQTAQPKLVWFADRVERQWTIVAKQPTLEERRAAMAEILNNLPLSTQASLWQTRISVEQALDRGRVDIAKQIVLDTQVTSDLTATKQAILDLFP